MKILKLKSALALTFCFFFAACAQTQKDTSTFDQFGGKPGIKKVVDDLMINLLANPKISRFFVKINQQNLKSNLEDQFCKALEGPCEYTGKNMADAHKGMEITEGHFNALVEDLQKAMDKNGVPERAQNKLLAKLAPLHRDTIEKK